VIDYGLKKRGTLRDIFRGAKSTFADHKVNVTWGENIDSCWDKSYW